MIINILYNIIKGDEVVSYNQNTETTAPVIMRLSDIPQILLYNSKCYELRGVVSFHPGNSKLRTTIGHYNVYAKRGTKNWQLFDDLKNKPIPVKSNQEISCELLVYTI